MIRSGSHRSASGRACAIRRGAGLLALAVGIAVACALVRGVPASEDLDEVATVAAGNAPASSPPAPVGAVGQISDSGGKFVGMASCTLSACHGRTVPLHVGPPPDSDVLKPLMYERSVWARDPHERADRALFESDSLAILSRLGVSIKDGRPSDPLNERWQSCQKCHNPATAGVIPGEFASHEGVGCEACHGPGERWIRDHWRNATWFRSQRPEELRKRGFRDTKDLFVRAEVCASCHVGQAGAQVDHDLIAAGHPMLAFELSTYQRMLPPHWNVERERKLWGENDKPEDHQLKLWLGGQLATAKAALELLTWRTQPGQIWPEFSEQECFTCHHNLADDGRWRADRGFASSTEGRIVAPWRMWNFGLIAEILAVEQHDDAVAALNALQDAMESALVPKQDDVSDTLDSALSILTRQFNELKDKDPNLTQLGVRRVQQGVLAAVMQKQKRKDAVASWERAAHLYFCLAAAAEDHDNPPTHLVKLHELLSEQPMAGLDSPAGFRGNVDERISTEQSHRARIRQLLEDAIELQ